MQGSAPVKYFTAFLTGDLALREHALHLLSEKLSEVDFVSGWYPFKHTSYYTQEMGEDLQRSFASFKDLLPPENLPKIKAVTIEVENKFREGGNRRINIDTGYIDYFKLVLASGKFGGHRVALTKGCYADFVMYCKDKKWEPLPWCFPDFASGAYNEALTKIRSLFKAQRSV